MLIFVTLYDIWDFLQLIILAMVSFGVPLMILQLNSPEGSDLIESEFNSSPVNMFLSQYILLLGNWEVEAYADNPNTALCYIFFFLATLSLQIMLMNMLIAIMTDPYEKVIENKSINGIMTKLELMSDIVDKSANEATGQFGNEHQCLVLVTPVDELGS